MKIYTVTLDLTLVLSKLLAFTLYEFNNSFPDIFIEAADPDDACYLTYCKFSETLLRQDASKKTAKLIKDIEYEVRIIKVVCKDEKKL